MWLLTANSVLKPNDPLDNLFLYFGYIDKERCGESVVASVVLDTERCYSHDENVSIGGAIIFVHCNSIHVLACPVTNIIMPMQPTPYVDCGHRLSHLQM